MDIYVLIAIVWLVSAGLAGGLGYLGGRTGDAMTLGALLGPVGFVLTLLFLTPIGHHRAGILPWAKVPVAQPRGDAGPGGPLPRAA
jgi:small-conductance mechanosensitive channel